METRSATVRHPRPSFIAGLALAVVALAACAGPATDAGATGAAHESSAPVVSAQASGPDCGNLSLTPAQTEGPYFTPGSPERASLVTPDMPGDRLLLTGWVVRADCAPVAGARVDFWQTDAAGAYDNAGYTLRGHQFTDEGGRYQLETVLPGLYPGRTRHIHVKVTPPGEPTLTTQLYVPNEPRNARDGIFRPGLAMRDVRETDAGLSATFTFVLPAN